METTRQTKNQHLLWRAGFGPSVSDMTGLDSSNPRKLYKQLAKASQQPIVPLDKVSVYIRSTLSTPPDTGMNAISGPEERKQEMALQRRRINQQSNVDIRELTVAWMNEMVHSKAQLREKMALFWHGHFACRVNNSLYQQQLLQVIRQHALANFGDLLRAVSKSASMLSFLNNQQNRKKRPNENFAREVMELFTMGRGHYTEKDIKEAARAFTGWGYERDGSFVFREKAHDGDSKTILGHTGTFNGDDVLDIILQQRQTAVYLCTKIYRYFVNEQADTEQISRLADRFFKSGYDISRLLEDIFTSDWFYEEKHIGSRIKSPVEYLAGIRRILPMRIQQENVQILLQRLLGQWLFNPPNVAGWPGGNAWIDSSSLMLRLRIPGLIKNEEPIQIKPKSNDDVEMGMKEKLAAAGKPKKPGSSYQIVASIQWDVLQQALGAKDSISRYEQMEALLLQTPPGTVNREAINMQLPPTAADQKFRNLFIALMSTPEYQLC